MAYVKRDVEGRIEELWEVFPLVFIVGPVGAEDHAGEEAGKGVQARAEGSGDFLSDREWSPLVNESLLFGLFPEVVLSDKKEEVRNLLVSTLILKEVTHLEGTNPKEVDQKSISRIRESMPASGD